MMLVVVPGEKLAAESVCILVTTKALRKLRAVFHRLELALRIRIVIGDIGPAVGLGHSQFSQEKSHAFDVIGAPRSACTVRLPGKMLWR